MLTRSKLDRAAGAIGLRVAGIIALDEDESPAIGNDATRLAVLGSTATPFWDDFERWRAERQGSDGPHPLDTFTRERVQPLAIRLGATALYPSDGPPYWPFQRWAKRAEALHASPLMILIHPALGLWHAYRAALAFADEPALEVTAPAALASPCESCEAQPCLQTCPVGAYDGHGYDVDACARYVTDEADCSEYGCRARQACPVGPQHRYAEAQQRFHLEAFLKARPQG